MSFLQLLWSWHFWAGQHNQQHVSPSNSPLGIHDVTSGINWISCSAHSTLALSRNFNVAHVQSQLQALPLPLSGTLTNLYPAQSSLASISHTCPLWLHHRAGNLFLFGGCFRCYSHSACKFPAFHYLTFSLQVFWHWCFSSQDQNHSKVNSHLCVSSYECPS